MDGQSKASIGTAYLLTGHPHTRQAIHLINHDVPENLYRLYDAQVIGELKGLDFALAREKWPLLQKPFFYQHRGVHARPHARRQHEAHRAF